MSKDNSTPRPWSISYKVGDAIICIGETEAKGAEYYGGKLICESVEPSNARLIVRAVNRDHVLEELVEGLLAIKHAIKLGYYGNAINIIEEALLKPPN